MSNLTHINGTKGRAYVFYKNFYVLVYFFYVYVSCPLFIKSYYLIKKSFFSNFINDYPNYT